MGTRDTGTLMIIAKVGSQCNTLYFFLHENVLLGGEH